MGGGSVIDSAKAIGYGVTNEGDVWDFYDRRRQASACQGPNLVFPAAAKNNLRRGIKGKISHSRMATPPPCSGRGRTTSPTPMC